jgi:predicted anti-sigma-YlaC factor YlaD
MMTCREITTALSEDRPLGWRGRLEMRLHLLMCRACGAFARQLVVLKESLAALMRRKDVLSEEESRLLEEEILRKLSRMKDDGVASRNETEDHD